MTKAEYRRMAIRLYNESTESYNDLYDAVRTLIVLDLLPHDWSKYIYELDVKLFEAHQ